MDDDVLITNDQILRGFLTLKQPQKGYRFNLDAILLADFVNCDQKSWEVADFCAGVGIIGLLLAKKYPRLKVTLVELQEHMVDLSTQNIVQNQLEQRVRVSTKDLSMGGPVSKTPYDVIVSCPPYYALSSGQSAPTIHRAIARQEEKLSLEQLVLSVSQSTTQTGRFFLIYPSDRCCRLLEVLKQYNLIPHTVRFVHPCQNRPAKRILVEARKGYKGGLNVLHPWMIQNEEGHYTIEAHRLLEGDSFKTVES